MGVSPEMQASRLISSPAAESRLPVGLSATVLTFRLARDLPNDPQAKEAREPVHGALNIFDGWVTP
ncbi:MAG: hypothetical protein ACT4TC_07175 [Myxococcaceae bacterium]